MYLVELLIEHPIYSIDQKYVYLSLNELSCGVRVKINFNKQEVVGFVLSCSKTEKNKESIEKEFGFSLKFIDEVIDDVSLLDSDLLLLGEQLAKRYYTPLIGIYQTMLPKNLKPNKSGKKINLKYEYSYRLNFDIDLSNAELTKKEKNLIQKLKDRTILLKKDISNIEALNLLLNKGIVIEDKREIHKRYMPKISFKYEDKIVLNEEQENAFNSIVSSVDSVFLLHGVTGSGKTEVYIKLIEYYLKLGMTALVLVPEISLTPLMISRILSYFANDIVAILHSSLTPNEAYEEYVNIKKGKIKIVVGTRSAIFAPLKNIGVICIDEEQDESYIQSDRFLYNAKDIAIIRAKDNHSKVILGSATPSIETMAKAKSGKYKLLNLSKRYNNLEMPQTYLIDRNDKYLFSSKSRTMSLPLIKALNETFKNNEQAILLINNKGYSRSYYCRECGYVFKCNNCDIPLVYHKEDNTLRCHHCENKFKVAKTCPNCGSKYLSMNGFGIEKVVEEFKEIFNEKYLVLDGDITKKSSQISTILEDFNENRAKCLIGTQIVAKGHDFKNVSLVAIINADTSLFLQTFKARELTFQLIEQLIGRCGRGNKKGVAYIQTSQKDDYAIVSAINNDYENFYENEIKNRNIMKYPPFFNLIEFSLVSKKIDILNKECEELYTFFKNSLTNHIIFKSNMKKENNINFKKSITIKSKDFNSIESIAKIAINKFKNKANIRLIINLNPYIFN